MALNHRQFLQSVALALLAGAGMLRAGAARAAEWNKKGFGARNVKDALAAINAATAGESKSILLKVPDVADDGARVEVLVLSKIANTEAISLLVDGNTQPLALTVAILAGAEPSLSTTLKLRKTSRVSAVVLAGGKAHRVSREVKVATALDCGRRK